MTRYVARRLVNGVAVFLGLTLFVFVLLHLAPGNPVRQLLGEQVTPEKVKLLTHQFGLDRPLPVQYLDFLTNLVSGNFGNSIVSGDNAGAYILARLPASLELAGTAALMTVVVGIPMGILMALKRNTWKDRSGLMFATFGVSAPPFWLGAMMIVVFAVTLGWVPTSGRGPSVADSVSAAAQGDWSSLGDTLRHIILPAATLAALEVGLISRLMRSTLVEELTRGYVRAARARGLPYPIVVGKHVLRNAMLPVLTVFGLELSALMGGVVIVETVFSWPGLGQAIYQAIGNRDYPLAQAGILVAGAIVILVNLSVDLLYPVMDPRIRYQGK